MAKGGETVLNEYHRERIIIACLDSGVEWIERGGIYGEDVYNFGYSIPYKIQDRLCKRLVAMGYEAKILYGHLQRGEQFWVIKQIAKMK